MFKHLRLRSLMAILGLTLSLTWTATNPASAHSVTGGAQVIDGDTLVVQGVRLRLEGIDAPETRQICQDPRTRQPIQCGALAAEALRRLIADQAITCHLLQRDRYGRFVGRCHVAGRMGSTLPIGRDLSAGMVASGWAVAYMADARPDLSVAEQAARLRGLGLWATRFDRPEDYRRSARGA